MSSVFDAVGSARRASPRKRSTQEVLEDHLALLQCGDLETDLMRNYAEDCVVLTSFGVFRGHDGLRRAARVLADQIGRPQLLFTSQMWHGELAFVEWSADTQKAHVDDGADSYWIRDGRIQAVTIRYTVHPRSAH